MRCAFRTDGGMGSLATEKGLWKALKNKFWKPLNALFKFPPNKRVNFAQSSCSVHEKNIWYSYLLLRIYKGCVCACNFLRGRSRAIGIF